MQIEWLQSCSILPSFCTLTARWADQLSSWPTSGPRLLLKALFLSSSYTECYQCMEDFYGCFHQDDSRRSPEFSTMCWPSSYLLHVTQLLLLGALCCEGGRPLVSHVARQRQPKRNHVLLFAVWLFVMTNYLRERLTPKGKTVQFSLTDSN